MSRINGDVFCDNCGAEITWSPFQPQIGSALSLGGDYCCRDCFDGLRCRCGERGEFFDERRGSKTELEIEMLGE